MAGEPLLTCLRGSGPADRFHAGRPRKGTLRQGLSRKDWRPGCTRAWQRSTPYGVPRIEVHEKRPSCVCPRRHGLVRRPAAIQEQASPPQRVVDRLPEEMGRAEDQGPPGGVRHGPFAAAARPRARRPPAAHRCGWRGYAAQAAEIAAQPHRGQVAPPDGATRRNAGAGCPATPVRASAHSRRGRARSGREAAATRPPGARPAVPGRPRRSGARFACHLAAAGVSCCAMGRGAAAKGTLRDEYRHGFPARSLAGPASPTRRA